jgi:hypothetical protein
MHTRITDVFFRDHKAIPLKERSMKFLYRYFGPTEYALDTIAHRKLYFSRPSSFNDPYDCRPKFSLFSCKNDPEEVWYRYFFLLAKYQHPGLSDDVARRNADAAILEGKHRDNNWLLKSDEALRKSHDEATPRVCCFSRSPRNNMMWAHYADNHKGVVLQFNKSIMLDGFETYKGHSVEYYSQHIPLEQYVSVMEEAEGDPTAYFRLIYGSKSCEWSSEDEERFFSSEVYVTYPEDMLTGLIFGSETPSNFQNLISQAISGWSSVPKLFKEYPVKSNIKPYFKLI